MAVILGCAFGVAVIGIVALILVINFIRKKCKEMREAAENNKDFTDIKLSHQIRNQMTVSDTSRIFAPSVYDGIGEQPSGISGLQDTTNIGVNAIAPVLVEEGADEAPKLIDQKRRPKLVEDHQKNMNMVVETSATPLKEVDGKLYQSPPDTASKQDPINLDPK